MHAPRWTVPILKCQFFAGRNKTITFFFLPEALCDLKYVKNAFADPAYDAVATPAGEGHFLKSSGAFVIRVLSKKYKILLWNLRNPRRLYMLDL